MKAGSQYVYVDESGRPEVFNRLKVNLVTAGTTSEHLVIAAVRTADPAALIAAVEAVAPATTGIPRVLHAVSDHPGLRKRVCAAIAAQDVVSTVIVMDKRQLVPGGIWQTNSARFYNDMLAYVLADFLQVYTNTDLTISRKDSDRTPQLRAMIQAISDRHDVILARMTKFDRHEVHFRMAPHKASRGLQVADYIAYAVFQAFERGDMTYYQILQPILGRVWDLARLTHYTRKEPMTAPP